MGKTAEHSTDRRARRRYPNSRFFASARLGILRRRTAAGPGADREAATAQPRASASAGEPSKGRPSRPWRKAVGAGAGQVADSRDRDLNGA
jgi:hypothetical protein